MTIQQQAYSGVADQQRMAALVTQFAADHMHVMDLPYRFSSWAFDEPCNAQLWADEQGNVLGWVVMQTPFWGLDYACHPAYVETLLPDMLAWADERAREMLDTPYGRPIWFANVFTTQTDQMSVLEASGFASQADVGENSWTKVLMRQTENIVGDGPTELPDGFVIRPLVGSGETREAEAAAYETLHRAAFGSDSMTAAWRARTLGQSTYVPELDLVAVAPDGTLAAFCVCWLNDTISPVSGQVEPLGVHPDYQGLGLGRAILSEGIRCMYAHGAQAIYVETDNYRDAAFALYESVGYHVEHDVLVYRKDYG